MAAYPRMHAWYGWFMRTQPGELPGSFRWRGREPAQEFDTELNRKTFASGAQEMPSVPPIMCHPLVQWHDLATGLFCGVLSFIP